MKTVITLAVALILGVGVAGLTGCGETKKAPPAPASGDKMEGEKKPDAAPSTPAPEEKKEGEKK